MKHLVYTFVALLLGHFYSITHALDPRSTDELKNQITPAGSSDVITSWETEERLLDSLLEFVKDSIFRLMALLAIGMFIYIGWRLLMARGNAEEFKKALNSFIYAAIGIFVVAAAWAIVRFVAGINIL